MNETTHPEQSLTTGLLRQLKRLGLSQAEVARRTGIPQPRLSRWINSINVPPGADDALKLDRLVRDVETNGPAIE